ncbi:hypothetical protein MANES_08G078100v8 [Manihot esculenta]|nr:hypothetical protein MANES_08G078100v8 [Manihot esculenta]
MSSVKNISTYSGVLNDKLIAKLSISQNESHPSIFVCPRDNDDTVDNMEHDAAKNLPPSTSCLTNVVDSMNDNIAVEARLLSYHSIGSSGMIYDTRSGKESQKMCTRKSKNKESVSLESNTIKENASEECSVSNSAYMDNLIVSEFDNTETAGAEGLVLTLCPKSLKKENQNKGKKGGMKSGSKNFSTGSMPRDLEAVLGCIGEGEVICEESLLRSTTAVNSDILKQPSNNFQVTVCSTVQTVAKENEDAPSMVESSPVNAIPSDSGSRKCSTPLRDLKDNKKQKSISGCSVNHKSKELISEVDEHLDGSKLKKRSHSTFQAEKEISQKMLSAARILRNLSGTVGSKEKSEQVSVNKGGSSMKKARRKIIFDAQATPLTGERKEKTCVFSPESLSLKRSRAGRLLLPTLEFWRNQIPVYDADRNITGIQEEFRASRGCNSEPQMRSSKRKGKSPKRH